MICNIHGTTGCSDEFSCGSCKSGYSGKACRACSKGYYVSDNNMKLKQMGEGVKCSSKKEWTYAIRTSCLIVFSF